MAKIDNQQSMTPRRAPGRPPKHTDEEIRKLLIKTATEVFLEVGYEKTRVQVVAAQAGISTRTFYKFIPNKAVLFRMAAEDWVQKELEIFERSPLSQQAGSAELSHLVLHYARLLLSPSARRLALIVITEMGQFPEMMENYHEFAARLSQAFDDRLVALCDNGTFVCSAPREAALLLRMTINGLQRQIAMGQLPDMTEQELINWAENCSQLFLHGWGGLKAHSTIAHGNEPS